MTETHEINNLFNGCTKTQKLWQQAHIQRHNKFLVKSTLEKPQCGENQWERGSSSYFFNAGNYISAKIKPTASTYLFPRIPCLNLSGRNPTQPPSKTVHRQPYRTDCTDCTDCEKRAQKFTATVWWLYGLYGLIKSPFFFICVQICAQNRYNKCCCTKSVPYGLFNAAGCLEIRASSLPWNSCLFSAAFFFSENGNPLLFLLSLNLSNSLGKNEFVFGLFPPLESLSDS